MPIYEYECKKCGCFEVMQKITEEPLKTCEKCGGEVSKLLSLSSFSLVGGGWYKDLYSSTGKSGGEKTSSGKSSVGDAKSTPATGSSSSSSSSSDSAPKSDTKSSTAAA